MESAGLVEASAVALVVGPGVLAGLAAVGPVGPAGLA